MINKLNKFFDFVDWVDLLFWHIGLMPWFLTTFQLHKATEIWYGIKIHVSYKGVCVGQNEMSLKEMFVSRVIKTLGYAVVLLLLKVIILAIQALHI